MSELTVADAIAGYLDHVAVERGLAANTVSAYRRDLARYQRWCERRGVSLLSDVTTPDVADFAGSLRRGDDGEPSLAPASAARVLVAVRTFHKFASLEGWCPSDVAAEVAPAAIPRRLPKALPYPSIERLLECAGDPETAVGSRDRALVEFLYGTGTRISEVVALDVDDVDLDSELITVTGKGNKQRRLPLGGAAIEALSAYLVRGRPALAQGAQGRRRPGPALFLGVRGARLSRQAAWEVVRHAAEAADLEGHVGPHTLRHSYATHLMEGGADVRVVQELLGHASVSTTQIYTLVTADSLRQVYRESHPRAQ